MRKATAPTANTAKTPFVAITAPEWDVTISAASVVQLVLATCLYYAPELQSARAGLKDIWKYVMLVSALAKAGLV